MADGYLFLSAKTQNANGGRKTGSMNHDLVVNRTRLQASGPRGFELPVTIGLLTVDSQGSWKLE